MIFIDVGCYHAQATEQFINWGQLLNDGDLKKSFIYSIEPNPALLPHWQTIRDRHIKHLGGMEFINKAAWIEETALMFSETDFDLGATVMPDKNGYNKTIEVPAFDFSTWLEQFRGQEVVIKMNCEGAEYPILQKMIQDKTDDIPQSIMVEFHSKKMSGDYYTKEQYIIKNINTKLYEWR